MTGGTRPSVTQRFENDFFYFQKWMNSMSFCYFCVDLFRAPKIMNFLCDLSVMYIIYEKYEMLFFSTF